MVDHDVPLPDRGRRQPADNRVPGRTRIRREGELSTLRSLVVEGVAQAGRGGAGAPVNGSVDGAGSRRSRRRLRQATSLFRADVASVDGVRHAVSWLRRGSDVGWRYWHNWRIGQPGRHFTTCAH
jgi:hypothetical protein